MAKLFSVRPVITSFFRSVHPQRQLGAFWVALDNLANWHDARLKRKTRGPILFPGAKFCFKEIDDFFYFSSEQEQSLRSSTKLRVATRSSITAPNNLLQKQLTGGEFLLCEVCKPVLRKKCTLLFGVIIANCQLWTQMMTSCFPPVRENNWLCTCMLHRDFLSIWNGSQNFHLQKEQCELQGTFS